MLRLGEAGQHSIPQMAHLAAQEGACPLHKHLDQCLHAHVLPGQANACFTLHLCTTLQRYMRRDGVFHHGECGVIAAKRFAKQVKGIRIGELVSLLWVKAAWVNLVPGKHVEKIKRGMQKLVSTLLHLCHNFCKWLTPKF